MEGNKLSKSRFLFSKKRINIYTEKIKLERITPYDLFNHRIPGIGERLAKKIAEIGISRTKMCLIVATTGELQRLQNLDTSDHTVELFMGVYGIGRSRALQFVMQGFRTLKDLLERGELNQSQRIGIELYNVSL